MHKGWEVEARWNGSTPEHRFNQLQRLTGNNKELEQEHKMFANRAWKSLPLRVRDLIRKGA